MAEVLSPSHLDAGSTMSRKKFATPPVKIACLACRASRTRCNGEKPCASCLARDRPCEYKPSRRGGPRVRKKPQPTAKESQEQPPPAVAADAAVPAPETAVPVERYIDPGAGLKNLGEMHSDSDAIFDGLFLNDTSLLGSSEALGNQTDPMARTYSSETAILNAYYIWIHPFFPILPPPLSQPSYDDVVPMLQYAGREVEEPTSPIALALSAILALIPCPQDPRPLAEDSVLFRRGYAQFLAQAAFECIEAESDNPKSASEPRNALDSGNREPLRPQFHPSVPIELEVVIALCLLSVYEYTQRGNIKKMRNRANNALVAAMQLSLHTDNDDNPQWAEARRRAWWMTYICLCQSSIVSNVHPAFEVLTSNMTTKEFPIIKGDPAAWPAFIRSQQAILTATQFVIELNKAMDMKADMGPIYQQMVELETLLEPLITPSEAWESDASLAQVTDPDEAVVGRSLRAMAKIKINSARIKVHRYCAFFDLPMFPGRHCDLKPVPTQARGSQELQLWPSCCNPVNGDGISNGSARTSSSPARSMHSSPHPETPPLGLMFPFSSHQSAKICLRSALNIAQAFDSLPYPNPTTEAGTQQSYYLGPASTIFPPRTMPSFACCAMQCAYVLLMVHGKTQNLYPSWDSESPSLVADLLNRLRMGLMSILSTLENYGSAFEAMGGMRDHVRDKVYSTVMPNPGVMP